MEDMMSTGELAAIDHIVVLMLENRSFDHMLGFLYADGQRLAGRPVLRRPHRPRVEPGYNQRGRDPFRSISRVSSRGRRRQVAAFHFSRAELGIQRQQPASQLQRRTRRAAHSRLLYALRKGPGWNKTLLIVTYDEHGGCYDHVAPPTNAVPPDNTAGEYGFDFKRFGLRVPTVLISPLIPPGTVFRVPAGTTPLDHTSILKTIEQRWQLPALTKRDAAAPGVGAVLSLNAPRTDDPLQGVTVPQAKHSNPRDPRPSHLELVHAEQISRLPVPDAAGGAHHEMPVLRTSSDTHRYIKERVAAWKAARARGSAN
jgi:hypothetical protein